MILEKLFEMQRKLDEHIERKNQVNHERQESGY